MSRTVDVPVTEREAIVVVARVEVPITVRVPVANIFPDTSRLPPIACPPDIEDVPTYNVSTVSAVPDAVEKVV